MPDGLPKALDHVRELVERLGPSLDEVTDTLVEGLGRDDADRPWAVFAAGMWSMLLHVVRRAHAEQRVGDVFDRIADIEIGPSGDRSDIVYVAFTALIRDDASALERVVFDLRVPPGAKAAALAALAEPGTNEDRLALLQRAAEHFALPAYVRADVVGAPYDARFVCSLLRAKSEDEREAALGAWRANRSHWNGDVARGQMSLTSSEGRTLGLTSGSGGLSEPDEPS